MERTISREERIRRAEEIYYRRKLASSGGVRVSGSSVNVSGKTKLSLFKKMILQLAICAVIYIIFYLIKNTNYIFSDEVLKRTKEFLSYDINFGNVYSEVTSFVENNKDKFQFFGITQYEEENTKQNIIEEQNNITNEEKGGIGGAETNELVVKKTTSKNSKKTQMELDAQYIKENYKLKVPLKGTVTSRYGTREATDIVSENHQGIDIGADTGTIITAAMEGTVTEASSEGEYGKHIYIKNGDVETRYAHCSKLLVKEGQKIAKVGETGRATGPHLHFEIRRDDRIIDPEYVLKF